MSVRAYRVRRLEYAKSETFNLWHNEKLVDFLGVLDDGSGLNNDCCGMVEIPVEKLEEAVTKAKELDLDEYRVGTLKRDIALAKRKKTDYLSYYCF